MAQPIPAARHRFRLASPTTALVAGAVLLALGVAEFPLASLAHQTVASNSGGPAIYLFAPYGVIGFLVALRAPRNRLGWILLALTAAGAVAENASFYVVACYRLRSGTLPLGWVALLLQPTWSVAIMLIGLALLLFPDGHLPSPRLRWLLGIYLAVGLVWMGGALAFTVSALVQHDVKVDSGGNLLPLSHPSGSAAWWGTVQAAVFVVIAAILLVSLASQVISYRRSAGEHRQQLKWLMGGFAASLAGLGLSVVVSKLGWPGLIASAGSVLGLLALPACMGVAILRYRLYDIDRVISRTLAWALITGVLVGVYAGLVLAATHLFKLHSSVAVAAATLAAAALFNHVRRRVQRAVDRRFNRARYDADTMVAAFAARLMDAVELDAIRTDLAAVVDRALEPEHVRVWTSRLD
ncbi:MAG: hypothetical protein WAK82_06420 [Streptosporangiaceae bacterium]